MAARLVEDRGRRRLLDAWALLFLLAVGSSAVEWNEAVDDLRLDELSDELTSPSARDQRAAARWEHLS